MHPLERAREFTKQSMEPWKEEPSVKMMLVIPLKLPSVNAVQNKHYGFKHSQMRKWKDAVQLAWMTQPSHDTVKYFKDRIGSNAQYRLKITAKLFTLYDADNLFVKWAIDALKDNIITDDSPKYILSLERTQERIDSVRKQGIRYDRTTGKFAFPETIIEIEMVERQEVLL